MKDKRKRENKKKTAELVRHEFEFTGYLLIVLAECKLDLSSWMRQAVREKLKRCIWPSLFNFNAKTILIPFNYIIVLA